MDRFAFENGFSNRKAKETSATDPPLRNFEMPSALRTRAEQDRLMVQIHHLAHRLAMGAVDDDEFEDIAAALVLHCVTKLRARRWRKPKNVEAFVRKLMNDWIADFHRGRNVERAHLREYRRTHGFSEPEWMSTEREWDEASIDDYQANVMKALPRRCRLAYYLIRVEGDTYKQAAERMQVSRGTICKYIARAHRLFAHELRLVGVGVRNNASRIAEHESRPEKLRTVQRDRRRLQAGPAATSPLYGVQLRKEPAPFRPATPWLGAWD